MPPGVLPECAVLCYIGSLADNMKSVISGDAGLRGSTNYAVVGVSAVLVIVSIVWATLVVRCGLTPL